MILVLIGLLAGIIGGMGIGGGTVLIPALTLLLGLDQHKAQSVNLLYFIPTAIIALIIHVKNKKVDFKTAMPIIVSGVLGAGIGACSVSYIPNDLLKKIFAIFLLTMGLYEMIR